MIDDYAANYVWLHKAARDAYTASVPQALETWVDDYHYTVGERNGLRVPMVPRITDEDLDAIQQRYHPEPGYDPALSIVQKYQRSRVDVLIDLGTHAIYVPLPSGAGVVKQSALVDAMRRRLAYVPPPPKPAPDPVAAPAPVVPHWYGGAERHELIARGYTIVGMPPAAHATSLDYIPTADRWLDEHEHDLRNAWRNVPKRQILSIILANTLLGLEHPDV